MFEHFYCESEKKNKKNKHFKCYVKMDYIYFKQEMEVTEITSKREDGEKEEGEGKEERWRTKIRGEEEGGEREEKNNSKNPKCI